METGEASEIAPVISRRLEAGEKQALEINNAYREEAA